MSRAGERWGPDQFRLDRDRTDYGAVDTKAFGNEGGRTACAH